MASLTVARVRGIPIRLHATFLLVLPLFAYLMARFYFAGPEGPLDASAWAWGSLLAVSLFGSVLLHELGHSLTAMREGVGIEHITLLPIGGVSAFRTMPREPGKEFRITLAGPLVNFVIAAPLALVAFTGVSEGWNADARLFLQYLVVLNVVLGTFNLVVPAFPMDGGRLLRSALVRPLGRVRATRVASLVGRGLAVVMGLWGALTFAAGGWLLMLIALFIYTGARDEEASTRLAETLGPYRVRDVMRPDLTSLPPGASVEEALGLMLRARRVSLPLVEDGGRVAGLATLDALGDVPPEERDWRRVEEVSRAEPRVLAPDDEAMEAVRVVGASDEPVLVLDDRGALRGVVTRADVARFAELARVALRRGGTRAGGPGLGSG